MSEREDNPAYPSEEGMGETLFEQEVMHSNEEVAKVKTLEGAIEQALEESYSRGEVPQAYQMDPEASLPLKSLKSRNFKKALIFGKTKLRETEL
jgi:hypothetical protein